MKAVVIHQYGHSDVLTLTHTHAMPRGDKNQVIIQVKAAAVNPLDWKIRSGDLRVLLRSRFPLVLGNDVSGTIVSVGEQVEGYAVGDEVFCMVDVNVKPALHGFAKSGGYAEYVVTRADTLAAKPAVLSHVEAAAVPLAALTAYQSLVHIGHVRAGQRVLINGASGGVGVFAVQIAKALGATVTAVCRQQHHGLMTTLGADAVVDYRTQEFTEGPASYDVIYDVVANRTLTECRAVLTPSGRFISNVASLSSMLYPYAYPLLRCIGKQQQWRHAWVKPSGRDLAVIAGMIASQQVTPVVGATFSLEDVQQAHALGERGESHGKIVLDMQSSSENSSPTDG